MAVSAEIVIRVARPADAAAVGRVLSASYQSLMGEAYDVRLLSRALPLMTRASPVLLSGGTYYLAERSSEAGLQAVGCGGWSAERPGTGALEPGLGHIRHFATDAAWIGRGIGRALCERCVADARAHGLSRLECYASLNGEAFYHALGFRRIGDIAVAMGPDLIFPSIRMVRPLR